MIRIFAAFFFVALTATTSYGQDTTATTPPDTASMQVSPLPPTGFDERPSPDHPPLGAMQLQREKWYYSIDEAMRNPEKVYKLSLKGEGYKYFPTEITYFRNLQVLNLGDNKIKEIPKAIADLQNLEVVILAQNKIRSLPDEMAELDNLVKLYLASNKLADMPAWIGGLGKLRLLDLAYNSMTAYDIALVEYRLPRCVVTH